MTIRFLWPARSRNTPSISFPTNWQLGVWIGSLDWWFGVSRVVSHLPPRTKGSIPNPSTNEELPEHLYSWYGFATKLTVFCRPPVKMNRTQKLKDKKNGETKTHDPRTVKLRVANPKPGDPQTQIQPKPAAWKPPNDPNRRSDSSPTKNQPVVRCQPPKQVGSSNLSGLALKSQTVFSA